MVNTDSDLPSPMKTIPKLEENRINSPSIIQTSTPLQARAFNTLISGIDNSSINKLFFAEGSSGSGKNYLHNAPIY